MVVRATSSRSKFHPNSYEFVFAALRYTQEMLDRETTADADDDTHAHISGQELLEGVRQLAKQQFGLMATTVFRQWGITKTDNFGEIVFELIDRGEMRKTDQDSLDDFCNVYDFQRVFDLEYEVDVSAALKAAGAKSV